MFAPYCPQHDSRVLLFAESIEGLERTDEGLMIHYRCTCGHRGVWAPDVPAAIVA